MICRFTYFALLLVPAFAALDAAAETVISFSAQTTTATVQQQSPFYRHKHNNPHTPMGEPQVQACPWDSLDMRARAQVWSKLSARHRDYHWRRMTHEERTELRKHLSMEEKKALRERFLMQHDGYRDKPYVLYKRLTKDELIHLREQVRQAHRQQVLAGMLKTPAQIEYEDQFLSSLAKMNDQTHQMLIITIQDNGPELCKIKPDEPVNAAEALPKSSDEMVPDNTVKQIEH